MGTGNRDSDRDLSYIERAHPMHSGDASNIRPLLPNLRDDVCDLRFDNASVCLVFEVGDASTIRRVITHRPEEHDHRTGGWIGHGLNERGRVNWCV